MRLDSLVRAIQSADFSAFREIALLYLAKRGYEPSLTDGPHDGGADFLIYVLPPRATKFAVQISVEQGWEKKLRDDARKALRSLRVETLLFLSTRTITEPKFVKIADALRSTLDVQVMKADAKDIASFALNENFTNEILRILGIAVPALAPKSFERRDLRRDVAYACAFFGTEAQTFRKTVLENAVITIAFQAGGSAERETIVERASISLGLTTNQRSQVTAAMDRMLQDGRLLGKNGSVALEPKAKDNWSTLQALQEQERARLRDQVDALLAPHLKRTGARTDAVDAVFQDIGALLIDAGRAAIGALGVANGPVLVWEPLQDRLRHLNATLDSLGILDRSQRDKLRYDLTELTASSNFGRSLAAGEVFINLVSLKTSHLFQALGADRELRVILDTSVAMPLLCSLLYETAEQDFFIAAKHAYDQLVEHEAGVFLPRDYLEEVASHLLEAFQLYGELVELDPDLRGSKNAFVAHYVALRQLMGDKVYPYKVYLEGFGLTEARVRGDREVARAMLMNKLQALFAEYGIQPLTPSSTPASARKAQEALAYAMSERDDQRRPPILVRHDVTTLGWLIDQASDTKVAYVLCTWDKLHPYVREREKADWDVLDPVALGDALSLAASGDEEVTLVSPIIVALLLSAEDQRRGAAVWDDLVGIEKEKLHDAALRQAAHAFKQDWVKKTAKEKRARSLQEAWEAWKAEHLPVPAGGR